MLWRQKILRIAAALGVAFAAAHTAERLKAPAEGALLVAAMQDQPDENAAAFPTSAVPQSASLNGPVGNGQGDVIGITSLAAETPPADSDHCQPNLDLAALPGALIHLALSAPCNRGERIIVRHSGLSFTAKTQADGLATVTMPALKSDAMVAVYLQDSRLILGKVFVPDASEYSRFAMVWELPAELELRVTEGSKVLVGSAMPAAGSGRQVMALGVPSVPSPVLARVYSVPGQSLGEADITGELRITPTTCGRTLRIGTVVSLQGVSSTTDRTVAVPLCGTAGDILVLKNLAPALKLAAPK